MSSTPMRRTVLNYSSAVILGLFGICAGLIGCSREPSTLEDLIARNTEAMGGEEALDAVKSLHMDLHVSNPQFEVDCIYRTMRPGKMRIDVKSDGKTVMVEGLNDTRGWQWAEGMDAPAQASEAGTSALRHGVELPGKLFGLHEMQKRGHRVEMAGREEIDGVNYYAVKLIFADKYTTTLYIDPATWLITRRRDVRALHPDQDSATTTIETRSSDFRQSAGVLFAFINSDVDISTGKELEKTVIKGVNVNPPMDEKIFDAP